jgi:hypothetical protein
MKSNSFLTEDSVSIRSNDSACQASSNNLNRQVGQYALAATVAGVSILALGDPAAGEVVITRKTIPIVGRVDIDMNRDGLTDLTFTNSYSFGSALLVMSGGDAVGNPNASALKRGAAIGPSADFSPFGGYIERGFGVGSSGSDKLVGDWGGNPKNRYLGVRFLINGETHYGWVRLTVTTEPSPAWSATITAYAYETVANKKILAGVPPSASEIQGQVGGHSERSRGPSVGMLALGSDGLPMWRRKETLPSSR